jgi:type IV pilus assembly protein PilB
MNATTPEYVLLESGALTQTALSRAIAERYGLDHLDLTLFHADMGAANLINSGAAKRYEAVPVGYVGERGLLVAMADPGQRAGRRRHRADDGLRGPPGRSPRARTSRR